MPPIPIYAHSPINAAKAAAVSPQTPAAEKGQNPAPDSSPPTTTAGANAGAPAAPQGYPAALPGASTAIPVPTGVAQTHYSPIQPTPTRSLPGSQGPPPPQPGAVPVPPGGGGPPPRVTATSTIPPPPRAGETTAAPQQQQQQQQQQQAVPYPPQMSIPSPAGAALPAAQRGTSTAFMAPAAAPSPLEGPPGYQQNVHAGEMDRFQRARQDALEAEERQRSTSFGSLGGGGDGADGEGIWSSAKKLAATAGEKLAGAETEVWKRINKGS
ncbi:hypothetical protein diail_1128 [Diaporthe ilicicola]|nr:hypothetical protein diail_1128 [Diaporthe ilicicola]